MSLVSLVYVSFATHDMSADDLNAILKTARTFNGAHNITGMLLYRDRYFIQALEGEEEAVDALYAKIQKDPRHTNVLTVEKKRVQERSFGDWSMGFKNLDQLMNKNIEGFTDFLNAPVPPDHFQQHPSYAKQLLLLFKEEVNY